MNEDVVLDRGHLAAYTDGDEALQRDVLDLFLTHAAGYVAAMARDKDGEEWRRQAHRLKGAARAIGALALARCAEAAEPAPKADRSRHCTLIADELRRLRDTVDGGERAPREPDRK